MDSVPSLKSLAVFEHLTTAESSVFERYAEPRSYRAGEVVASEEALLVVREGSLRLYVDGARGRSEVAAIEGGGILGELDFFEPEPVPLLAEARADLDCIALDRRTLRSSFRYSRTGAIKFMVVFARSLSGKIRSANEALEKMGAQGGLGAGSEQRPAQLGEVDVQHLQSLAVARSYDEGMLVFREGDASAELFVIREGEVEILRGLGSPHPMPLARLGPGDFFGEMAFVDQDARSASAIARTPLRALVVPSGALERVIEYNVGTALHLAGVICKIMARRLNATLRRIHSS